MIFSYMGICIFSLLSTMSTGFISLSGIRFCVGMSFGLGQPPLNAFIGEITPSAYRVHANAFAQGLFCVGELYSAFLIWFQDPTMHAKSWRMLIVLGAIPSAVFLFLAIFMLSESPSFLLVNGRRGEAEEILGYLRDSNGAVNVNIDLAEREGRSGPRRPSLTIREKFGVVMGKHLFFTTLVVCASVFTLNFLFYGGLYAFPQILPNLDLEVSPAMNLMFGAVAEVPGFLLAIVLCRYLPRKTCMLLYLLCVLASCLVFSFAGMRIENHQFIYGLEMLLQLGLVGNKLFTAFGFLVVYVYSVEVFPTVARTMGGSLCLAAGRLGAMIAPSVFAFFAKSGQHAAFFCTCAAICAVNALLVLFLPFETKDILLQDHPLEHEPLTDSKTP